MSPRAAWRLETLGFTNVYDYTAGEADWFAYGLPMEGAQADVPRVGGAARPDVPRCGLRQKVAEVSERVLAAGWNVCAVVNDEEIVLGLLREVDLRTGSGALVADIMRPGPATYRPDALVSDVATRLRERAVAGVLITRSDGSLIGWLRREDAEKILEAER